MTDGEQRTELKRSHEGIPNSVIKRLPVYHRFLSDLAQKEVERVSSRELAVKIGINSSQLRQDLSLFGSFGQQGYGYRVLDLLKEVERILGLHNERTMVLIGAGNIGRAIANYQNFRRRGFTITAIFDDNPTIIGEMINNVPVQDIRQIDAILSAQPVQIGILAIPAAAAQTAADALVRLGIKAIWNFAPVSLKVPSGVVVETVHIGESLMILSFKLQQTMLAENATVE